MREMSYYGIGNTPLIELEPYNGNKIFVKLEGMNFLGSIKARAGYQIIRDLPSSSDGKTIIESTSGNLGTALGYFCKETGRKFLCLVDKSIAKAKLRRLEKYGIEYEFVEPKDGMDLRRSRIKAAEDLAKTGLYHWVNQYDNPSGVKSHYETTGPEIWEQTNHELTHLVCAMGSGGTICGASNYLKGISSSIHICGAEPYGSTIFGTDVGAYICAGAGFAGKPGNFSRSHAIVDIHDIVRDDVSIEHAKALYDKYRVSVGITGGMAYALALRVASSTRNAVIVFIAADRREEYEEYL